MSSTQTFRRRKMNLQSLLHSAIHVIFDNILAEKYVHRKSSTWNLKMNRELVRAVFDWLSKNPKTKTITAANHDKGWH